MCHVQRELEFADKRTNAMGMVSVFVGYQYRGDVRWRQINPFQTSGDFLETETGIDQQAGVAIVDHGAIPVAATTE
tara:strand:- start:3824 stop:4051 length:228 start_codon:yes stop_codon:yes gene_type:complete